MRYTEEDRIRRLEEMKSLAVARGGECLSKRYTDNRTKLRWRCATGHEWDAIPLSVERDHWCAICGNERQGRAKAHSIEMMQKIAASRGGQCLSSFYKNNLTKLRWRCKQGHEWEAVPGSITGSGGRKGSWCPICAGKLPEDAALEQLKELAVSRGGVLVSTHYSDARTSLTWKCAKGHEWRAVPDAVKHGTWCPVYGGSHPLNLEMMKNHARKYRGECLSGQYINSKTHLRWRCCEGHEWEAKSDHVLKGHWCPICAGGVSERTCRALLERMTGVPFPKQRPKWLRNERGKQMELDGYATSLEVAFEYHGEQHYQHIAFFHKKSAGFEQRQRDDEGKRRLCEQHEIVLFEIPYSIPHDQLQVHLARLLRRINKDILRDDTPIEITQLDVWHRKDLEELRGVAISRGGSLLSGYYINNSTKLRWRCADGHEWEATRASVTRGSWCSICGDKRSGRKRTKHANDEMNALAKAKGGICISGTYINSRSRFRWRCVIGHEWETQASVIMAGHWCPKCEKLQLGRKYALTLEQIQETAKERGGQCLSDAYLNARQKLTWRCADGHTWQANANSVRQGSWCPICRGKRPKPWAAHAKMPK